MSEMKSAPLPADVKFLLCEDVRSENTGKLLIVGLYPGELVLMNDPKPVEGIDAVSAIASLALLFMARRGLGRFESNFEITAPDGRRVAEAQGGMVELLEGKGATAIAIFRPFPVLAFGEHRIRLRLDATPYEFTFDVRRADGKDPKTASAGRKRYLKAPMKRKKPAAKAGA
jgi:hypothetical protein